jgi:hypothetical protein
MQLAKDIDRPEVQIEINGMVDSLLKVLHKCFRSVSLSEITPGLVEEAATLQNIALDAYIKAGFSSEEAMSLVLGLRKGVS